jgi:hypothetical protein
MKANRNEKASLATRLLDWETTVTVVLKAEAIISTLVAQLSCLFWSHAAKAFNFQ